MAQMAGMARYVTTEPGRPAFEALARLISAAKRDDALAAVTVVVPSPWCGLSARRLLASGALGSVSPNGRPGLINVEFVSVTDLAESLGSAALASEGRRPLTHPLRAEAVRTELVADAGVFASVARHPITVRVLDDLFVELRRCSPAALDRLAGHSARSRDLVRLYRGWHRRVSQRWYDGHDVVVAARHVVEQGRDRVAIAAVGAVVVFLPSNLTPAEHQLIGAFGDRATIVDVGDDAGVAADGGVGGGAGADGGEELRPTPLTASAVSSAPDPDEEVRAAVREIATHLHAGVPLHRMAIAYSTREPYSILAAQHLDAAGLPYSGPGHQTLAQTVTGRTLLGLLEVAERGWRRSDVIAWLTSSPVLEADGRLAPAARWDTLSRQAGVIEGVDQWIERLRLLEERIVTEQQAATSEEPEWRQQRWADDLEQSGRLRRFVADIAAVAQAPSPPSWTILARWANGILDRTLGNRRRQATWPAREQHAWRSVRQAIGSLTQLDVLGIAPDADVFRSTLERELDVSAGSHEPFGRGVFLAPLPALAGVDLDVVVIVGANEGVLPGSGAAAGLLSDQERAVAGNELSRANHVDAQRRLLRLGLGAASRRAVMSYPRADPRRGRARLPSRWVLEVASTLAGRPVLSTDLEAANPEWPWLQAIASFEAGLRSSPQPASLQDHDVASLVAWRAAGGEVRDHPLARAEPKFMSGVIADESRRSARFTAFDGKVPAGAMTVPAAVSPSASSGPSAPSDASSPGEAAQPESALGVGPSLSATSLERYATCPRRYFFSRLGVAALEKPEEITRLSPRDKGTLVHTILERFVRRRLAGDTPTLDQLLAIADEECREFEARGLTGKALWWRYDRRLLHRELARFFQEDHLQPLAAELAFGVGDEAPVEVEIRSQRLRFRGFADRVDRAADGRLVVTDYKTGSTTPFEGLGAADPTLRGTRLQLPLYALAGQQRFGGELPVRSRYWFVSERMNFEEIALDVDDETVAEFRDVVEIIVDAIAGGIFPARPGPPDSRGGWENCRYCEYDLICPQDRGRQWERKREAPELAAYATLAEGEQ